MIVASQLSRRYGTVHAVRGLDFEVPSGVVCGFLGPNGAGKSSTIRMIVGLQPPDEGRLTVAGFDVLRAPGEVRRRVGYLPESTPLHPELRVEEYLRYRAGLAGVPRRGRLAAIDRVVGETDLGSVRRRLVGALSKGFRQRVGVAAALVGDPELLVLDEPTVGLDPSQVIGFRDLLRGFAGSRTVLVSSHILAEVEAACDHAVIINRGRLVGTGSIEALLARAGGAIELECAPADRVAARETIERCGLTATEETLADGWTRLRVASAEGDVDQRERLARALAERGVVPRDFHRADASLESLFLSLVAREDSAAPSAMPASATAGASTPLEEGGDP